MSILIKNPTTVVGKGAVIEQIDIESLNKIQPSRYVDIVYLNKSLNDERMMELLSQINYVDFGSGMFLNIVFCPIEVTNQSKIIAIVKLQIEDFLVGHMIVLMQGENITPLWFSQQLYDWTHSEGVEDELNTPFGTIKVETAGWTNITDSISIGAFCSGSLGQIPVGDDNELLKLVLSTTPFIYYKKELKGVFNGDTLQANVGGEYFDGKTVDVEKMLDSKKLPLNIDVEYAKIKVDDTEVDLIGEYDGTTIEITENGTLDLEPLISENKLPLNVEVNVGSGGSEEIDTVAIYRATRNPNWPYLPLPSEIAATSNKDTVYLLYDASGGFVCPTFTIEYDTSVFWSDITIEKYMNTTLVSSETIDGQNGVLVRMQYDYTDEDWDTYNYLLIKIEQQSYLHAYPKLEKLDLTTTPQYNGVDLNANAGNGLLEVSGNANICEVLFGGSSSIKNNRDLTYFSFNGIARTSLSYMFYDCRSLITLPEIRFSAVSGYEYTDASSMFYNCFALQVPLFDTGNVTNMSNMFYNCYSLQTVPLFDTGRVTNMSNMFESCYSLQTVPLFDTSNVTNMKYMFRTCYALQTVPLFDTGRVTDMSLMFVACYALQTVPLFDTGRVTNMKNMFESCYSLQTVPLFDTSNVTNMQSMFVNCHSLQTVPLFDTSNVTNINYMFRACYALQTVPLFDISKIFSSMRDVFDSCYSLQTVPLFDTGRVSGMGTIFYACFALVDINMYNMKIGFSLSYSTLLTREAIVKVLNNLATVTSTQTLTLGTTNLAKLTDEDKLIATDKGWTLA